MKHKYEIREFGDDEKETTIERFVADPKEAKQKAKGLAERYPGIYTLYKVETVEIYFTKTETFDP